MLWLCAGYIYLNFQDGRRLSESQSDHLVISGERRTAGSVSGKIWRQDNWNCLRIISSAERGEIIQDNSSQARRKRRRGVRERKRNKGKEYGCRPVSEWINNGQAAFPYQLGNEVMTTSSWLVVEPIVLNHISTLLEILLFPSLCAIPIFQLSYHFLPTQQFPG